MASILRAVIDERNIQYSGIKYAAGIVNLASGASINADEKYTDLYDYILASSAIPVMMPIVWIGGQPLVDGGTRNVNPFGQAIKLGATEIINILCHAENLPAVAPNFGNPLKLLDRLFAVITNEIIENDLAMVRYVNKELEPRHIPSPRGAPYRKIVLRIIRPAMEPDIAIDRFDEDGIKKLLDLGRSTAKDVLAQPPL